VCLSIPSKVVRIEQDMAWVDTLGAERQVSLALMDQQAEEAVCVGDFVLIHIGFVMNKIDEKSALESLALYQAWLADEQVKIP
jgi:hydrogenase expression/formation protein HypC